MCKCIIASHVGFMRNGIQLQVSAVASILGVSNSLKITLHFVFGALLHVYILIWRKFGNHMSIIVTKIIALVILAKKIWQIVVIRQICPSFLLYGSP